MNERCKDSLRHAWGKTQAQKEAEKLYNANYYQQNSERWKINREKLRNLSGNTLITPRVDLISGFMDDPEERDYYVQKGKESVKTAYKVPIEAVKIGAKTTKKVLSLIGEVLSYPVERIKNTKFVQKMKYYLSKATI